MRPFDWALKPGGSVASAGLAMWLFATEPAWAALSQRKTSTAGLVFCLGVFGALGLIYVAWSVLNREEHAKMRAAGEAYKRELRARREGQGKPQRPNRGE